MQALPPPDPPQQVIVVTGRALPRTVAERVAHSEVLDEAQLRTAAGSGVDQLLDRFAGVQLFRRSDARSAHPTSQGVTLRALGGNAASRVQLIVDGVPHSDPFGGWIAWPALDARDLAEIRVSRGGGNVVSGPGALGGVIDLTSATDEGVLAAIEGGSRSAFQSHFSARQSVGAGLLAVSLQGNRGDGFIPIAANFRGPADRAAPYRNASGRTRWIAPLGTAIEAQLGLSAFVDERERGLRYTANRTRGGDASLRLVADQRWAWSLLGFGQVRNFRSSFASVDPKRSEARRASLQYDVPGKSAGWSAEIRPPLGERLQLRLGADGRWMRGESRELASYSAGRPQRDRRSGGRSRYAGLFGELSVEGETVLLTTSARIDRWGIADGELVERSVAGGAILANSDYPSRHGWRPTGRVAGAMTFAPGLTVRSAAYLGWRLPTINELFRPFRAGPDATAANPDLRPERLRGAEAGLDWTSRQFKFSLTAFTNRLEDAIANVTLAAGPGSFPGVGFVGTGGVYRQRQNIPAIRVHGVEASARWSHGAWLATLSSSLTDPQVHAAGSSARLDGLRPAQTPRVAASAILGWDDSARSANLALHYEGRRFEDDFNRQELASALTVDASASLPIHANMSLVARAENALNAEVEAGVTSNGVIERARPRTLWLGLRFARTGGT
ncbi:MAG: TonB-dependent receptor [Sphingomicrobium sp.]